MLPVLHKLNTVIKPFTQVISKLIIIVKWAVTNFIWPQCGQLTYFPVANLLQINEWGMLLSFVFLYYIVSDFCMTV